MCKDDVVDTGWINANCAHCGKNLLGMTCWTSVDEYGRWPDDEVDECTPPATECEHVPRYLTGIAHVLALAVQRRPMGNMELRSIGLAGIAHPGVPQGC